MNSNKDIEKIYWDLFRAKFKKTVAHFVNHQHNYIEVIDAYDDYAWVYFPKYIYSDNLGDYIELKNNGFFCAKILINKNNLTITEYNFVYRNSSLIINNSEFKIHYDKIQDEDVCADHPKQHLQTTIKNIRFPTNEIEFPTFLDLINHQFTEQNIKKSNKL
jgi:hypothetical protein